MARHPHPRHRPDDGVTDDRLSLTQASCIASPDVRGDVRAATSAGRRWARRHPGTALPAKVRRSISARVLERDHHCCRYCGGLATVADHVIPKSRGGRDGIANRVAACTACDGAKRDRTPAEAGMVVVPEWNWTP